MKKKIAIAFLCALALCLSACNSNNDTPQQEVSEDAPEETTDPTSDTTDSIPEEDEASEEIVEPANVTVTMDELYGDTNLQIQFTGLKEYQSIEGDSYTDTPSVGNRYVVLFLKIENYSRDDLYFNAETITSAVDDQEISHTFLVNNPEGYSSIFDVIPAETTAYGYMVWEVPENWQTIRFHYYGWDQVDHIILDGKLNATDLQDPVPFEQL